MQDNEYRGFISVPFMPPTWIKRFIIVFLILIVGFLVLKYLVRWELLSHTLSNTFLSDISILITLLLSFTFVAGCEVHTLI